jgi:SAM-dependent methyltransferase
MYFPDKVKSIREGDRVLEIGPGGNPYPRADVFLEKRFGDEHEAEAQRAYAPALQTDKKVVYYAGETFPFKDKEFDYVICSHVLEHVPDVDAFLKEVSRVAKRGYLEYPVIYYDYLFNIPQHLSILLMKAGTIYWMSKSETVLDTFRNVQALFYESLFKNYGSVIIPAYQNFFFQGFEWENTISSRKVDNLELLTYSTDELKAALPDLSNTREAGIGEALGLLGNSLLKKLKRT